jgi:hypothetical protein
MLVFVFGTGFKIGWAIHSNAPKRQKPQAAGLARHEVILCA